MDSKSSASRYQLFKISEPNSKHKIHENSWNFWIFCLVCNFDFSHELEILTFIDLKPNLMTVNVVISRNKAKLS